LTADHKSNKGCCSLAGQGFLQQAKDGAKHYENQVEAI